MVHYSFGLKIAYIKDSTMITTLMVRYKKVALILLHVFSLLGKSRQTPL